MPRRKSAAAKTKAAVAANPVTTTTGVGGVIVLVGKWLGWDDATIAAVSGAVIAAALAVRAIAAWYSARKTPTP